MLLYKKLLLTTFGTTLVCPLLRKVFRKKERRCTTKQKHRFTSRLKFVMMYWKRTRLYFKFMPRKVSSLYNTLSRTKTLIFLVILRYNLLKMRRHMLLACYKWVYCFTSTLFKELAFPNCAQAQETTKGHLTTLTSNYEFRYWYDKTSMTMDKWLSKTRMKLHASRIPYKVAVTTYLATQSKA